MIFDDTPCALGEGPLWHPSRGQLFWFDIIRFRLHTRLGDTTRTVQFDEHVSAAGWVDDRSLLVASETRLFHFDLETEASETICLLEADTPATRSNDGRADPHGGFWIGTMGKAAEPGAGAIYRFHRGELRTLFPGITIPNAICFAPGGKTAYFADTPTQQVMRQALDAEGWPEGAPEVFIDLTSEGLNPDGCVTDAKGNLWLAQWGASRVARHGPDGTFLGAVEVEGRHASCPAFGGPDLTTLFVTTARQGLSAETLAEEPRNGMTFAIPQAGLGLAEHRVIL